MITAAIIFTIYITFMLCSGLAMYLSRRPVTCTLDVHAWYIGYRRQNGRSYIALLPCVVYTW